MKRGFMAIWFAVFGVMSMAAGGDGVGNGGGSGEKNVILAFLRMPYLIGACLNMDGCDLSKDEQELLLKILHTLKQHPPRVEQLEFVSEQQKPGTFLLDGKAHGPKTAKTGDSPGTIWINLDHINTISRRADRTTPIDFPEAAALLLDELAHWVEPRFSDRAAHADLDRLCARFRDFLMKNLVQSYPFPYSPGVSITTLSYSFSPPSSDVLVATTDDMHNLTPAFDEAVAPACGEHKYLGFLLTNLHGHLVEGAISKAQDLIRFPHHAWLVVYCVKEKTNEPVILRRHLFFDLTLKFTKRSAQQILNTSLNPDHLSIAVEDCHAKIRESGTDQRCH